MPLPLANPCADSALSCNLVYRVTGNETAASVSGAVVGAVASILGLLLLATAARWLLHRFIDRLVRRAEEGVLPGRLSRVSLGNTSLAEAIGSRDPDYRQRRIARARAMGTLLKSLVTGVIYVITLIMVISELGYPIGPLLASAGIVGVALGFGAQSLVKDFLSGIFMIFEDQFGVGDVITLGDVSGTVEAVSLRVTRVRDEHGTVWYLRNGEILRLGNRSQNWGLAVVDIAVAFDQDLGRVRRVVDEVAAGLRTDPDVEGLVLENPEVVGLDEVTGDTATLRVTVKTAPMRQDQVARVLRERVKARFAEEDIEVPQQAVWPDPATSPAG